MKDTSEMPDGNEQAKATPVKPRPVRSKPENATPASQEQDGRSTQRRRTPPPTNASTTPQGSHGTEHTPARPSPTSTPRPGSGTGNQRSGGTGSTQQTQPRPPHNAGQGQRTYSGNNPGNAGQGQRPAPSYGQGQQRFNNSAAPTSTRPAPVQQRQNNGTQPHQNTDGTYSQRQNTYSPSRPTHPGNAPTQRTPSRGGGNQTPGHGSQPRSGNGQPYQGQHRSTSNGRPATVQRPAERRAPVVKEKPTGPIAIPPQIVVKDLAELLQATPNEVIKGLIKHGIFASINQVVEYDKAALVAQDIGFEPTQSAIAATPAVQSEHKRSANEEMMATRDQDNTVVIPPVVTIMGHVDHGKTSLLDTIRKTKVAAGEAGGITQHIGAYQVEINGKKITFLDTPGHEAFTAMRARGAQVTHIAVIVVAADDGVMPQTREAIAHAQAAKVPIVIALNKIDKDNANPDYVKQQLAEMGVVIEEYGGDIGCIPVSARKNIGIDELLEYILLLAEVQDIRANPNRPAVGVIVEARLEKNSGPTATVLVQQGTLKMGDNMVVGALAGKVRAMFNDRGKRIQKAPPSTPVSVIGLPEVPQAGDRLEVAPDERTAKQRALLEAEKRRDETMPLGQVSLDTLYMQMQEGKVKELNIVLKCDVQGSSEAIKNALTKVGEDGIKVRLIHEGIGNISETDVHLAAASDAIVIGFNVKADGAAQRQAQKEGVDIRYYNVIYKLTDDIQAALTGMLEPTYREVVEGHAEVIQIFKAGKNTVIAGCRVTDGKLTRSSQARIMRKGEKIHEGKIASLRRGKDDVREIASGYECGIVLEEFTDFEVGDIIEAFAQERVKPGM